MNNPTSTKVPSCFEAWPVELRLALDQADAQHRERLERVASIDYALLVAEEIWTRGEFTRARSRAIDQLHVERDQALAELRGVAS